MKTRSTSHTSAVRKTYVEPLSDSAPSTPSSLSASETLVHLKDGPFFPSPTALSTGAFTSLVPLPGPSVGPNTLCASPEPITTPAAAAPLSSSTSRKKRRVPTSEMSPEKLQAQRAKNRVKQARYRARISDTIVVLRQEKGELEDLVDSLKARVRTLESDLSRERAKNRSSESKRGDDALEPLEENPVDSERDERPAAGTSSFGPPALATISKPRPSFFQLPTPVTPAFHQLEPPGPSTSGFVSQPSAQPPYTVFDDLSPDGSYSSTSPMAFSSSPPQERMETLREEDEDGFESDARGSRSTIPSLYERRRVQDAYSRPQTLSVDTRAALRHASPATLQAARTYSDSSLLTLTGPRHAPYTPYTPSTTISAPAYALHQQPSQTPVPASHSIHRPTALRAHSDSIYSSRPARSVALPAPARTFPATNPSSQPTFFAQTFSSSLGLHLGSDSHALPTYINVPLEIKSEALDQPSPLRDLPAYFYDDGLSSTEDLTDEGSDRAVEQVLEWGLQVSGSDSSGQ